LREEKKLSIAALSQTLPERLKLHVTPCSAIGSFGNDFKRRLRFQDCAESGANYSMVVRNQNPGHSAAPIVPSGQVISCRMAPGRAYQAQPEHKGQYWANGFTRWRLAVDGEIEATEFTVDRGSAAWCVVNRDGIHKVKLALCPWG
jgi:hypothetical protein